MFEYSGSVGITKHSTSSFSTGPAVKDETHDLNVYINKIFQKILIRYFISKSQFKILIIRRINNRRQNLMHYKKKY